MIIFRILIIFLNLIKINYMNLKWYNMKMQHILLIINYIIKKII